MSKARRVVGSLLNDPTRTTQELTGLDDYSDSSFPASDPIDYDTEVRSKPPRKWEGDGNGDPWPSDPVPAQLNGESVEIDHGHIVIAAITSCTNTSNPSVMLGAGLLAKKAVEKGLRSKPWVKTSLAPGSRVVTDYYEKAGLTPYLNELGFDLVGYGCTTCIGNSGPLIPEVSRAVGVNDLSVSAVLSGNRNFEGRIHGETKMNFLASPPLVVAYALAGTMNIDLLTDSLGTGSDGEPVYLRDIWPSTEEIEQTVRSSLEAEMFSEGYADVFSGDENWTGLGSPKGTCSSGTTTPPMFGIRPTSTVWSASQHRCTTSVTLASWRCWVIPSPPTTSRLQGRSVATHRLASTWSNTVWPLPISTPTGPGAGTTR